MTKVFVRILWLLSSPMLLGSMIALMWGMHLASVTLFVLGYVAFLGTLMLVMLAERLEHNLRVSPRRQQGTAFNPWK
jgi:hypothetical protein